jgi:hypothetical protein
MNRTPLSPRRRWVRRQVQAPQSETAQHVACWSPCLPPQGDSDERVGLRGSRPRSCVSDPVVDATIVPPPMRARVQAYSTPRSAEREGTSSRPAVEDSTLNWRPAIRFGCRSGWCNSCSSGRPAFRCWRHRGGRVRNGTAGLPRRPNLMCAHRHLRRSLRELLGGGLEGSEVLVRALRYAYAAVDDRSSSWHVG